MKDSSDSIRFAVVGHEFGRYHVRTLSQMPGVRLVAVADRRSDDLDSAAEQYSFTAYRDAAEMLQTEALDAVVIATSPKPRLPLIELAVKKNLALFVEKPWASDLNSARHLADLSATSAAPVMVGFSFRFHPALAKLRTLINGELGVPRMLSGQYVFAGLPPTDSWIWDADNGNGFINENSCHLFDAVCHLMGTPIRVHAEAARFSGGPMDDAAVITLRFAEGGLAALTCGAIGTNACDRYPHLDLFAERGKAELIGRHHVWQKLRWATHQDDVVREFAAPPEQLGSTRYTHALKHFVSCIRQNATPTATPADGVRSVAIAMAVAESSRVGQAVDLSL